MAHSGELIGRPYMLTANLGYPIEHKERIRKPELCGGALLDLGVYPINLAFMLFGNSPERIMSCCSKNELGVDLQNSMTFIYPEGEMAVMQTTHAVPTTAWEWCRAIKAIWLSTTSTIRTR